MKTIFDNDTRQALIERIKQLDENNTARWGKMNIAQMLQHCIAWEEMALGKRTFKRSLLGRFFGRIALKDLTKDDAPLKHNMPTSPGIRVRYTVNSNIAAEKKKWIALLEEHAQRPCTGIVHPFFGQMTQKQTGQLSYKHTDHHLRQFNG
jgi:hypothetical protein